MRYTADFETTTDQNDCRVWAFGVCEIGNPDNFIYGDSIEDFLWYFSSRANHSVYFHNLKFDGEFLISWLFMHGYTHVKTRKELQQRTFCTLISDKGQFYTMTICFDKTKHKTNKLDIFDSLKILPFSVDRVAKGFNLPFQKLEMDYKKKRPKGYKITEDEIKYLQHDVTIMALALDVLFKQDMDAITQGSNAMKDFKRDFKYNFERIFPPPVYDADIRQSYKGGYTYLAPRFKNKRVCGGIVLDVNSLYPWVMRECVLPFGEGVHFIGKAPPKDPVYQLYTQMVRCNFQVKPGHLPTIQLKGYLTFVATEYATSSMGEDIILCLTNVDLELFYEHYDVYNEEWIDGWRFKATSGLFNEYIDKWSAVKIESKISGNNSMYVLAKLMLNALYGKFALNPNVCSKNPVLIDNIVHYIKGEPEKRTPIYIPVGTFITSYAREKTIRTAQSLISRFIYADTDSLHLTGKELPEGLEINDTKLGAWKHELNFSTARFIRQKTYIERGAAPGYNDYRWKITCAGMPDRCHRNVTFRNFKPGKSYDGKLMPMHVKGGIVLVDTVFTIKK